MRGSFPRWSAFQDTIRTLAFLVVPRLIVLTVLGALPAGIRYWKLWHYN